MRPFQHHRKSQGSILGDLWPAEDRQGRFLPLFNFAENTVMVHFSHDSFRNRRQARLKLWIYYCTSKMLS